MPTIERGEDIFGQLENFKNEYNEWVLPAQVRFQIDPSHSHLAPPRVGSLAPHKHIEIIIVSKRDERLI